MSTNSPSAVTQKIHQKLNKKGHDPASWNDLYAEGLTPWNMGQPAQPLVELIETKNIFKDSPGNLRVLIPGCGEGYDVMYFASLEITSKVIGLEISDLALEKIQETRDAKLPVSQHSKVDAIKGDFFEYHPSLKFDVIFDYTFFCAIHPSTRPKWAENMKKFLKKGGKLITLIFPIGHYEGGPPFAVSVEAYKALLSDAFDLEYGPAVSEKTNEYRKDRELVAVWERK